MTSKTNFNDHFQICKQRTGFGSKSREAGERVQLFAVLFFCRELQVLSRCYIPHSPIPVCEKCQYTFSLPGLAHLLLKKKLWLSL